MGEMFYLLQTVLTTPTKVQTFGYGTGRELEVLDATMWVVCA